MARAGTGRTNSQRTNSYIGKGIVIPGAGGGVSLPLNTIAPSISGTPEVGQTLTGNDGTWTGSPTSFNRAWRRNGSTIAGAFGPTYDLVPADDGKNITFASAAVNAVGAGAVAVSAGVSVTTPDLTAPGGGPNNTADHANSNNAYLTAALAA